MHVDLILLSRDLSPPRPDVWEGIQSQRGVVLHVHRLIGTPRPEDPNRWATIARARNQAKTLGASPWVMCLDDDVVLAPDCLAQLVQGLRRRPEFAALAADSAGEMSRIWEHWDYPSHVGMAAVMFRRPRLAELTFRWEDDKCECLCCCEDLRAASQGIGYHQGAQAWHRPSPTVQSGSLAPDARHNSDPSPPSAPAARRGRRPGRILAAFDRRDQHRFRTQFLTSLRDSGNHEPVWAFAYGLFPTELARLEAQPGVTVTAIPHDGVCPALRRLGDFQQVVAHWPEDTPVAYWDAGDILFQAPLEPLWDMVDSNPDLLLITAEPKSYPENPVIRTWSDRIHDPSARARAFETMSTNVFLNSGFAAGTASAILSYLRAGDRLLNSSALHGVGDWGDQVALNLYCHANPGRWKTIDPGWNYTLAGREPDEFRIALDGRAERFDDGPVHVLHGNAETLRWLELSPARPFVQRAPTPAHALGW